MSVCLPRLVPIGRTLLRDHALTRIRDAIVGGELAPGSVVKDTDLAARLGLSVAPVRAALARLGDEGLIDSKPQSHTRVTPWSTRGCTMRRSSSARCTSWRPVRLCPP